MVVKLTFPKRSHTLDDLRPIYEEFKILEPRAFEEWRQIESRRTIGGPDELRELSSIIQDFIRDRTEWESRAALITAFSDFRQLINKEIARQRGDGNA